MQMRQVFQSLFYLKRWQDGNPLDKLVLVVHSILLGNFSKFVGVAKGSLLEK